MKIAFIGARGVMGKYSGIETYYEEVGSRLVQRGHELTVYCRSHFTPAVKSYRGIRIKRIPTIRTKHLETIVHSLMSTMDALWRDYEIVQFHALGSSPLSIIPRLTGSKTVVSVRGLDGARAKWGHIARWYLHACESSCVRFPSAVSVVSRELETHFANHYSAKVNYIPNGVTLRPPVAPDEIQKLGLGHRNYILYVGRLTPEKGCHHLIQAFKELHTDLQLVFVGDSTYARDYVASLKQHQSDRIHFLGFQTGKILEELFSNAYFYVLPSDIEGLSISLLEAMAYGACVLVSDIPENIEAVADCGFTFKAGDADHLRRTMMYLLENPDLVRSSGKMARAVIEKNYTWDLIAHKTELFFQKLLSDN